MKINYEAKMPVAIEWNDEPITIDPISWMMWTNDDDDDEEE